MSADEKEPIDPDLLIRDLLQIIGPLDGEPIAVNLVFKSASSRLRAQAEELDKKEHTVNIARAYLRQKGIRL